MERARLLTSADFAARSLRTNIRTIAGSDGRPRKVLVAGPHQLASVWTRDLCFAVGGLFAAGEADTVRSTLEEILSRQRADGLFPRLLDSYHPAMRYVRAVTGGLAPLKSPLVANFKSEHFVDAIDTNSLVVWAAAHYALRTENFGWAGLVLPALTRAMDWYDLREEDGLVLQHPFSDWKDTVSTRRGAVFFTQLLRWKAYRSLQALYAAMGRGAASESAGEKARQIARRTNRAFWDAGQGFYVDTLQHRKLSTEGNLASAAWGFADKEKAAAILRAMDARGLNTPWGPRAGERYPMSAKAGLACLAGIAGYHDDHIWLWITALQIEVLDLLHRRASRDTLLESVSRLIAEGGRISEVYRPEDGREVRTWLFRSERPFSWSAAMLLEVFERLSRKTATEKELAK